MLKARISRETNHMYKYTVFLGGHHIYKFYYTSKS